MTVSRTRREFSIWEDPGDLIRIVVAQEPKLAPYFAAMRKNLAVDLRVEPEQVNLKGTTTEGMGFAGREEGIAAHAVALLCRAANTE